MKKILTTIISALICFTALCGCSINEKPVSMEKSMDIPENGIISEYIFKRKKLRYREDILDNMNEDELVANLFRINQTKQKLLRDNVQGEKEAKDVHYEVGKKVRKAIADIGGMMPEDMPTPKKSLKVLEKEKKKLENTERKRIEEKNSSKEGSE